MKTETLGSTLKQGVGICYLENEVGLEVWGLRGEHLRWVAGSCVEAACVCGAVSRGCDLVRSDWNHALGEAAVVLTFTGLTCPQVPCWVYYAH